MKSVPSLSNIVNLNLHFYKQVVMLGLQRILARRKSLQ